MDIEQALNVAPMFIDFEASSLTANSYPIEVAWTDSAGEIETHLISPKECADWTDWNEESAWIHKIRHCQLLEDGKTISWMCDFLTEKLANQTLYSDAPKHDTFWLYRLFEARDLELPNITIKHMDSLMAGILAARDHSVDEIKEKLADFKRIARFRVAGEHRAHLDARYLYEIWSLASGHN